MTTSLIVSVALALATPIAHASNDAESREVGIECDDAIALNPADVGAGFPEVDPEFLSEFDWKVGHMHFLPANFLGTVNESRLDAVIRVSLFRLGSGSARIGLAVFVNFGSRGEQKRFADTVARRGFSVSEVYETNEHVRRGDVVLNFSPGPEHSFKMGIRFAKTVLARLRNGGSLTERPVELPPNE